MAVIGTMFVAYGVPVFGHPVGRVRVQFGVMPERGAMRPAATGSAT